MTTTVRIRAADGADDAVLADITARAYLDGGHLRGDTDPYLEDLRDVTVRREQATMLVAEIHGAVVGSVTIAGPDSPLAEYGRPDEQEIRMLSVDPVAGGRGVGSALLQAAIEHARAAGAHRVVLHTLDSMTGAHRLYERVGFVREPDLDDEPVPGVVLRAYGLSVAGAGAV